MVRKRGYWWDDQGSPQGGWTEIGKEWDDPTFDAVAEEDQEDERELPLWDLTPKQRFVIECIFGIGRPQSTEQEVADYMGITHQAVHKLKEKALRRLRGLLNDYRG